jgi:hypothetical protein
MPFRHALAVRLAFGVAALCASPDPATAANVLFDLEDRRACPFPSDVFTVDDPGQLTGRRVNLALPDPETHPDDHEDISVINTIDGFNISPRLAIPFDGEIDPATTAGNAVFLMRLSSTVSPDAEPGAATVGVNHIVWDPATLTLYAEADRQLDQHTAYALVITSDVRTPGGAPITSEGFARFRRDLSFGRTKSAHLKAYRKSLLDALATAEERGVPAQRIVAMSVFTTQSVTWMLEKIRARLVADPPAAAKFTRTDAPDSGRLVFSLSGNPILTLSSHTGTASTGAPTFTTANNPPNLQAIKTSVAGAVARLAFGRCVFRSWLTPVNTFPLIGSRDGVPEVQSTSDVVFMLCLPAGAMPQGGWPVAIYGPGSASRAIESGAFAARNASQGVATMCVNSLGNGNGPLSTMKIGTATAFGFPGRGRDMDHDGVFEDDEGRDVDVALGGAAIIGQRDSSQQVVADFMQLVRIIEAGIDVEGDGVRDIDPDRIGYMGHSMGGQLGPILLAIEPRVKVGYFISGGGGNRWKFAGLRPDARAGIGAHFAARTPSLLNSPGLTTIGGLPVSGPFFYDENMPMRDEAPRVNEAPGAIEIQEWYDDYDWVRHPGSTTGYYPHLRKRPLPGMPAKAVILANGKGDQSVSNPLTWEGVRAGDLEDRVTFVRGDLFFASDPTIPAAFKSPHRFALNPTNANASVKQLSVQAQTQAARFLASDGTDTIDPDGAGPIFETPIPLPLPEGLHYIP